MKLYTPVKVTVAVGQIKKLKADVENHKATSSVAVKINLQKNQNEVGFEQDTLLLTKGQIKKLETAKVMGRSSKVIRLSRRQIQANLSHTGGFLPMLLGLAARALPTLAKGLATGLVTGAVSRAISKKSGDGLYLFKSGHCIKVDPVKGNGLYLQPHQEVSSKDSDCVGDGLYLKHGSSIYNGEGLILGESSPFKNIPILGWLL